MKIVKMKHQQKMLQCAKMKIDQLQRDGWIIKNVHTLQQWQKQFQTNKFFVNPLQERLKKDTYPHFLQNEDDAQAICFFCCSNLAELTAELVQDYVLNNVIPFLIVLYNDPDPDSTCSTKPPTVTNKQKKATLKECGLTVFSTTTVYHWMLALSFTYKPCKYYFVDGHEKEGTKKLLERIC